MFIEEGRVEMEKYHKNSRIKPISIGDRVFLKYQPKRKENRKLQPIFDGPYRVVDKISDVVVKLRNLRTGKTVTVHADKVKILHEDNVNVQQFSTIRRAYPFQDNDSPDFIDSWSLSHELQEEEESVESSHNQSINQNSTTSEPIPVVPRYNLRSSTTIEDVPRVTNKPLEYHK